MAQPTGSVVVLPQREGFSPQAAGAVALMVQRLAAADDLVLGSPTRHAPFAAPRLRPIQPGIWPPLPRAEDRYAHAVARAIRAAGAGYAEVHNRARLAARIGAMLPALPMALYLHNDPQTMRGADSAALRRRLLARMQVICVSRYVADRFCAGVEPRGRVHVIPNALDLDRLPPPVPAEARERCILFAGRPVHDKGADSFITAMARLLPRLPGWRAQMIGAPRAEPGAAPTPFWASQIPRAEAAGIHLAGYLPHAAVMAAMSRAAIVVVPSRWQEPFGLTALEALACGAALVTTRRGGLPEVAGEAARYADPDDPAALAALIGDLATDAAARAALSQAGLARAQLFNAVQARTMLQALRVRIAAAG